MLRDVVVGRTRPRSIFTMRKELLGFPQRSNECACLSHARAIERVWEWIAPFQEPMTISIEKASAKIAADLNFAVCVSFRENKAKTKQLRFLP